MGFWEDIEILEGTLYNEKYNLFMNFFTESNEFEEEELNLINNESKSSN